METERAANKYKQVEFMQDHVSEEFEAVISGVATFGFWAETVEHKCEGMVSMADLSDLDNFVFSESEYALIGRGTGLKFAMGDKVKVRVVSANLAKRQIDFMLTEVPEPTGKRNNVSFAGAYAGRALRASKGFKTDKKKHQKNKKR